GNFPSGHVELLDASGNFQYYSCWAIDILPYVEQDNLFKQYNNLIPNQDLGNQAFCQTYLAVFTCPMDLRAKQIFAPETLAPDGHGQPNPPLRYMASSYKAMTGIGDVSTTNTFGGFWNEVQTALKAHPNGRGLFHGDGYSGLKPERMASIQ